MVDDVLIAKAGSIERCLRRVREEYQASEDFLRDQTRQDAVMLNLLRATEQAIDIAMHIVRVQRLGVPQTSREGFSLLVDAGVLDKDLALRMQAMVGFRNIAIHEYQKLDLDIVEKIIENHLVDFERFVAVVLKAL